jgi:hypothetical protein
MADESSRPLLGILFGTIFLLSCCSIYTGHLKPLYDPSKHRKEKKERGRSKTARH